MKNIKVIDNDKLFSISYEVGPYVTKFARFTINKYFYISYNVENNFETHKIELTKQTYSEYLTEICLDIENSHT